MTDSLTVVAAVADVIAAWERFQSADSEKRTASEAQQQACQRLKELEAAAAAEGAPETTTASCRPPRGTRKGTTHWLFRSAPQAMLTVRWDGNMLRRYFEFGVMDWTPDELTQAGWRYVGPVATSAKGPTP